jgi:preprotein translocase subunit SecG
VILRTKMALPHIVSIENMTLLGEFSLALLFMQVLLLVSSVFLILLILVQRGKGGGLTGALGGMGGQSAFGSKAGDAFTKITVITAMIWIMLCMVTIAAFNPPPAPKKSANNDAELSATIETAEETSDSIDPSSDQAPSTDDAPSDGDSGEGDGVELDLGGPESSDSESADATEDGANPDGDGN